MDLRVVFDVPCSAGELVGYDFLDGKEEDGPDGEDFQLGGPVSKRGMGRYRGWGPGVPLAWLYEI